MNSRQRDDIANDVARNKELKRGKLNSFFSSMNLIFSFLEKRVRIVTYGSHC